MTNTERSENPLKATYESSEERPHNESAKM